MADVTLIAAFGGGVISFMSPCVLPIVPAYLAILTGLEVGDITEGKVSSLKIARDAGLFIAGFSAVFIALGLSATALGGALFDNQVMITKISGLVILAMSMFVIGSVWAQAPWLYGEKRFHPDLSRFGPFAAPVAGAAFGFGWTPCIGPVLTSVLAVAATEGSATRGATLLAAYSLGLGLPFMITGLAYGRVAGTFGWIKRHYTGVTLASAGSLAMFGLLLTFNKLTWATAQLQSAMSAIGLDGLVQLG